MLEFEQYLHLRLKKECGLPAGLGQGALAAEQLEPDEIRDVQGRN
jgi:hypothetical protein